MNELVFVNGNKILIVDSDDALIGSTVQHLRWSQ